MGNVHDLGLYCGDVGDVFLHAATGVEDEPAASERGGHCGTEDASGGRSGCCEESGADAFTVQVSKKKARLALAIGYIAAVVCIFVTIESLVNMTPKPTPTPVFSEPIGWKFCAAKAGHTFHIRGCPSLAKQPPPDQMVYGTTTLDMRGKQPCPYCIK